MKLSLMLTFCLALHALYGQPSDFKPIASDQSAALLDKIAQNSTEIQSLQAHFTQETHLSFLAEPQTAKGVLYYKSENLLRWEYQEPKAYCFILNAGKIIIKDDKGATAQYNATASKSVKAISEMILNMVNGKGLKNNAQFDVSLYGNGKQTLVKLIPRQKEMQKMFKEVALYLNNQDYTAVKIEMQESSGDKTAIVLSNVKKNISIIDTLFR